MRKNTYLTRKLSKKEQLIAEKYETVSSFV